MGRRQGRDIAGVAQRLADEALFPSALDTDATEAVPRDRLDALADEGLYGLRGPVWAGGLDADLDTICAVTEALASGCLSTTFVWAQHTGTAFVAGASGAPGMRRWVRPLCRGEVRSGLALAGALPGPERLRATRVPGGWRLTGRCPWVSGWGRIDVLHTAALADDDSIVWSLVEACEDASLRVERVGLVALNATATVDVSFEGHVVPDERVTVITPPEGPAAPAPAPATLRVHGAFALGVAARCCRLLGPSPLDGELTGRRTALATADAAAMPAARAGAAELAVRSAAALMSSVGGSSLRCDHHAQRLAREALFVSVFAARSPVREAFLTRLGAHPGDGR